MFNVITKTVTFTNGTAVNLGAISGAPNRCSKLRVEPASSNTHVCYTGDASLALGTSTVDHVIKQIAKPTAADAVLDFFLVESQNDQNTVDPNQFSVDGTTSEKARVSFYVG